MTSLSENGVPKENKRTWHGHCSHVVFVQPYLLFHLLNIQQCVEEVDHLDGSRVVFSGDPSGQQQLLTSLDLTQEVVISPGLPTPPLSPYRSARLPSGEHKVSNTFSWIRCSCACRGRVHSGIQYTRAPPCGTVMYHRLTVVQRDDTENTSDMIVFYFILLLCIVTFSPLTDRFSALLRSQGWMEVAQPCLALDHIMGLHNHMVRSYIFKLAAHILIKSQLVL